MTDQKAVRKRAQALDQETPLRAAEISGD